MKANGEKFLYLYRNDNTEFTIAASLLPSRDAFDEVCIFLQKKMESAGRIFNRGCKLNRESTKARFLNAAIGAMKTKKVEASLYRIALQMRISENNFSADEAYQIICDAKKKVTGDAMFRGSEFDDSVCNILDLVADHRIWRKEFDAKAKLAELE